MAAFKRREAEALRRLISDYLALIESAPSGPDPVMARLYPAANLEDEAVASKFRELTESDLTASKRSNAETALDSLGKSGGWQGPVSEEQQESWLSLLTDLRLIIGVREGVTEEMMEMRLDPSEPAHHNLLLMHYLGALQEDLLQAMQGPLER